MSRRPVPSQPSPPTLAHLRWPVLCTALVVMVVTLGAARFAQASVIAPGTQRLDAWTGLQDENHGNLSIQWGVSGTPEIIVNQANAPDPLKPVTEDVGRAALQFFDDHAALFSLRAGIDAFEVRNTQVRERLTHVALQQRYRGVKVEGGEYALTRYVDGTFSMLAGYCFPNLNVDVNPRLKPQPAFERALKVFDDARRHTTFNAELVVLADREVPKLAYSVLVRPRELGSTWQVLVDAQNGAILDRHDLGLYDREPVTANSVRNTLNTCQTTPKGNVYLSDPCHGGVAAVDLLRLTALANDQFQLNGSRVHSRHATLTQPTVLCGQFTDATFTPPSDYTDNHTPDNSHFDESNVYYHVDRIIQSYVDFMQFNPTNFGPSNAQRPWLDAVSHSGSDPNNAFFDFPTGKVEFGGGDYLSYYDLAKKEDVIYHEVGHAITWSRGYRTSTTAGHPSQAIGEGYGDYMSAAFTNDPGLGECAQANCSLPNIPMRTCNTDWSGSNGWRLDNLNFVTYYDCDGFPHYANQDPHYAGMIWSGALWQLRTTLPANYVDGLAYHAVDHIINVPPTWQMMADALLNEERSRGGLYLCQIKTVLRQRGFYPSAVSAPTISSVVYDPSQCRTVVSWTVAATDPVVIDGFNVYQDGTKLNGAAVPPGQLAYLVTPPAPGTHGYQVAALDCGVESPKSSSVNCTVPTAPNAPTAVSASDGTLSYVHVTWTDNSTNETGFKIERRLTAGGAIEQTWTVGANVVFFDDNTLVNGTTHNYCVKSLGACSVESAPGCDDGRRIPPPLAVSIAGQVTLTSGQLGTWTITVSGGTPPYNYAWTKYRDCPGAALQSSGPAMPASVVKTEILLPPCWQWDPFGSNSNVASTSDVVDFRVKCVVTDAASASGFSQRNVDVLGVAGQTQASVSSVSASDGVNGIVKVQVNWGPSDGAEGFRVYRAGTLIYTATQNERTYTDPNAPAAISSYCVAAYSGANVAASVCDNGYPYIPLTGTVTGPSQLAYNGTGTYTVNMTSGGIPPLTRQWYHATYCGGGGPMPNLNTDSGGNTINVPPCNVDYAFGTGGTSVSWTGTYDVTLSCRVTDAVGRTTKPAEVVDVIGVTPNGLTKGPEGAALQATNLPDRTELLAVGNPAHGATDVDFALAEPLHVSLTVFDIAGRRVESLADVDLPRGRHRVSWNAALHPAGMYVYRFTAGNVSSTRRFMVVR